MRWSLPSSTAVLLSCCCVLLVGVSVTDSQLIPNEACTVLAELFKIQGCLQQVTATCQLFAFLFTIHTPAGGVLCDRFLCDNGYNQQLFDTACQDAACPSGKDRTKGICPNCQSCCTVER